MKYPKTAYRLQGAMEDMKINAATLSQKTGIGKSSISQYVNGSHKPSNIAAEKMARVLYVNPMWLMGFDVTEDRTLYLYSLLTVEDKARVHGYIENILEEDTYKKESGVS